MFTPTTILRLKHPTKFVKCIDVSWISQFSEQELIISGCGTGILIFEGSQSRAGRFRECFVNTIVVDPNCPGVIVGKDRDKLVERMKKALLNWEDDFCPLPTNSTGVTCFC